MACKDVTGDVEDDMIEIPENAAFVSRQARMSNELRIGDELTDFTIISEGKKFRCHSHVLASSSSMFLAMFRAAMKESSKREMEFPTVPPNVVKVILVYIYLRTVRVPSDLLLATIEASNYLQLHELKEDCLQQVYQMVKPSNVVSLNQFAHELNLEELKQKCSKLLSSALAEIANSSEFLTLSVTELISCFSDIQESDVDSDDKLDAVIKWIRQDDTDRKKEMKVLMQYIDLSQCSMQCIEEALDNHSELLDKEMCLKLAKSVAMMRKQDTIRRNRRGRERMLVIIAGHKKACWRVDESMMVTELCKGFQCSLWYSACKVPLGFVLTGGMTSEKGSVLCMMFVVSSQYWVKLTSMRAVREKHGSIYLQGKIFVFGGYVSGSLSKSVQSLQIDGGEWMDEPDLPVTGYLPKVACIGPTIFLLECVIYRRLLCLDTEARVWNDRAEFPGLSAVKSSMISVNDQLLVAGGTVCARYTPATDMWIMCTAPTLKHCLGALVCYNDKIYLMGGGETEKVEEYDLASDQWSVCSWELPAKEPNLQAVMIDAP